MDAPTLFRATSLIGFSSSFFTSGVFFCSSYLVLPLLYDQPTSTSTSIFTKFYHAGIFTLVPLAAFSGINNAIAAYLSPEKRTSFALAASLTVGALLWTAAFMMSTNNTLVRASMESAFREKLGQNGVVHLLKKWYWMNLVRAGLTMAGGVVGLSTALGAL